MPVYLFEHPETRETVEVVQKMNDFHIYIDEDGLEWSRVFLSPNASIGDNLISADTTQEEFVKKTKEKNYNLGEMWNLSKELGAKRKQIAGVDHVKEKAKKKYEQKCNKPHPLGGGD